MSEQVVIVSSAGVARLQDEVARVAAIKALGSVPADCGDEIPAAPARGAFRVVEVGARRKGMRLCDAFDVMEAQARKSLFSKEQKEIGRAYATLYERLACSGLRCTSVEVMSDKSGGSGGEYIDGVLCDRERLTRWDRRIGGGAALEVRRVRPSARRKRGVITDARLVHLVCVGGLTLSQVLDASGWVAPGGRAQGSHIKALRTALCASLDRMLGGRAKGGLRACHHGAVTGLRPDQWYGREKGD